MSEKWPLIRWPLDQKDFRKPQISAAYKSIQFLKVDLHSVVDLNNLFQLQCVNTYYTVYFHYVQFGNTMWFLQWESGQTISILGGYYFIETMDS